MKRTDEFLLLTLDWPGYRLRRKSLASNSCTTKSVALVHKAHLKRICSLNSIKLLFNQKLTLLWEIHSSSYLPPRTLRFWPAEQNDRLCHSRCRLQLCWIAASKASKAAAWTGARTWWCDSEWATQGCEEKRTHTKKSWSLEERAKVRSTSTESSLSRPKLSTLLMFNCRAKTWMIHATGNSWFCWIVHKI